MCLLLVGDESKFPRDLPSNVFITSLSHREVTEALCAFDFGILLHRRDVTNHVAFPNKVGEYLNARLRIIIDSEDIGCVIPEFSHAFVKIVDADFSTLPEERYALDLCSIMWPKLAAELLDQYSFLLQTRHKVAAFRSNSRTGFNRGPDNSVMSFPLEGRTGK